MKKPMIKAVAFTMALTMALSAPMTAPLAGLSGFGLADLYKTTASSANGSNGTTDPGTTDPGTTDPGTTDPGTTDPGTTDPGTTDPGTTDPGTTDPGTTDPGTTDPGTTDPGTTDPGTTDPGTTDPGTTDPGTTDPGTTDPGTTDPGTTDPGTTDPGTTDPGTTDPGTTDPGTTDPGTTDPGTTDPSIPGKEVQADIMGIMLSPSYSEVDVNKTEVLYPTVLLDADSSESSSGKAQQISLNAANADEYSVIEINGTEYDPIDLLDSIGYQWDNKYIDLDREAGLLYVTGKNYTPEYETAFITATLNGFETNAYVKVVGYTTEIKFTEDPIYVYKNHTLYLEDFVARNGNDALTWELSAINAKGKATNAKSYATIGTYGDLKAKKATVNANGEKVATLTVTVRSEHGAKASAEIIIEEGNPVKKLAINPKSITLEMGDCDYDGDNIAHAVNQNAAVEVTATDSSKETTDDIWLTLNKNNKYLADVDYVDGKIVVDGVYNAGTAKYTLQSTSGKKATFTLKVTANKLVSIDWISYNDFEHIYAGQKTKATVYTTPWCYKGKVEYTLVSGGNDKLKVNKGTGAISVNKGKTIEGAEELVIKATGKNVGKINNTGVSKEQKITVFENPIKGVEFTDKLGGKTLYISNSTVQTFDYNVNVLPVDAKLGETDGVVTYSVNNKKVASIDPITGVLTPLKSGKVTVTASVTLANGKTKKVTDKAVIKTIASKITIKNPDVIKYPLAAKYANKKQTVKFTASFPKGAGDKETVTWTKLSGDDSIYIKSGADKTTLTVEILGTAKAGESAEFMVRAKNGATARATVTICDKATKVAFADTFKVGNSYKTNLTVGPENGLDLTTESKNLIVTYTDEDKKEIAEPYEEPITYTVNKKGIVNIKDGTVYGVKAGTVKVTAKTASGKKATITITVTE